MRNWLTALALLSLPAMTAQAADLDITLGNDSLRGEYVAPIGRKVADNVSTLDFGVFYNEESNSDVLLGHAGLMVYGDAGARKANVNAGLGGRVYLLDADSGVPGSSDDTGLAIALGGTINGRVPDLNRMGGRVWVFYSPDIASFDDLEGYTEYGASIDYQVIRQASLVLGYRKLRAKVNGFRGNLESGGFFGMRFSF